MPVPLSVTLCDQAEVWPQACGRNLSVSVTMGGVELSTWMNPGDKSHSFHPHLWEWGGGRFLFSAKSLDLLAKSHFPRNQKYKYPPHPSFLNIRQIGFTPRGGLQTSRL